jgi:hypothetical protein
MQRGGDARRASASVVAIDHESLQPECIREIDDILGDRHLILTGWCQTPGDDRRVNRDMDGIERVLAFAREQGLESRTWSTPADGGR